MNILQAIILSIVEGITEFLPVSSTGHLILAGSLLHISETDFVKSFEIFIQFGAIMAVVLLYAKTILVNKKILLRVGFAFIPTAVIGFILYRLIKKYLLGNPWIVVVSLFLGGVALILIEILHKEKTEAIGEIQKVPLKKAAWIGLIQSLSVVPGVSRAAATIVGGQLVGLTRKTAVEFSFLLAIPTMAAATGLDLFKSHAWTFTATEWNLLAIGFFGAFLTAFFVIKFFLQYIQKHTFIPFGIYRILVACVYTLLVLH